MQNRTAPAAPLHILIVEDEYLIGMETCDLLEENGYDPIGPIATVGAALAILDDQAVDACVLDVNLRGERSWAVAMALKARNVPFVLSSAYKQESIEKHEGFKGVPNIGKPVSPETLLGAVAEMTGR